MTEIQSADETLIDPVGRGMENSEVDTRTDGRFRGWNLSPAIWSRIAAGFAALCLVKLLMLVSLRKYLFEIHWRIGGEPVNWFNSVAFYLFAILVGWNLWRFGTRCQPAGARVVRWANLCVLVHGALFLFLTFHEGDKNYLSAVMNEFLSWKNIGSYLEMNFCFRTPYLTLWVLGYGLVYYGFWRKGREYLMLRVTAVFAAAYIVLCLRDFREYRSALVILDCIGIACLIFNGSGTLSPLWISLPVIWAGSLFVLFRPFHPRLTLTGMSPEFSILLWGILILLAGISAIAWKRGFLNGWSRILPFAIAAFLLVNTHYPAAENYENALCMGFTLPRYFLGEFGIMTALLLTAGCYRIWRPTGSLWWLDVVILLLVIVALADLRLTQIMEVRLDWDVLSLAFGETPKMMWRMTQPYLLSRSFAVAGIAVCYALSLWAIRCTCGQQLGDSVSRSRGVSFAMVAFVLLGVAGICLAPRDKAEGQTVIRMVATSPLLKRSGVPVMDRATFVKTTAELGMGVLGAQSQSAPLRPKTDLNVVMIFQESTYNKHLSLFGSKEETQPLMAQYKDRMELFPNFFSSFAGSINARFATFTGLYPVPDFHDFTTERVPVKSIFETLHKNAYECSMFYSSFFDYTGFRDFLRDRDLDGMFDADNMPDSSKANAVSWGLREDETLGAIRQEIRKHAVDKGKFFITYVPAAPHNPFDGTPDKFQKKRMDKVGDLSPLYFNELLYMDSIISSIVGELKDAGLLDKTIIIITADHGEMLGENGGPVGHGWAITPELANVPLIIMDPTRPGYRINDTIGSQVDLMPTILDLLGLPAPARQLYQGASLYSPDLNNHRAIYLNSMKQYGIIEGTRFICGDRGTEQGGTNADSHEVFEIKNEDSHTSFVKVEPASGDGVPSISTFDQFQRNLLRNYSDYSRMFGSPELAK